MTVFLVRLRLILAAAGLIFAVAGIATDNRTIIWVAIGLLGVTLLLRFFLKKTDRRLDG